jgi:short-subunit dehydrogenase
MDSHEIRDSVIVITGASSGIGLATATALARRGARLVLVARGEEGLAAAARACETFGAQVLSIPADVTNEALMHDVVRAAIDRYGRIDVWINNAAVLLYGRLVDTPMDAWQRVIETNLFGYVHGARAALSVFLRQGRGILINNASSLGLVGIPFSSSYVASKFAIIGLSESLRLELREHPGIHVCTLTPPAADTPIYLRAGNFTGREVGPVPLVYDAQSVAKALVALVEKPRQIKNVGVEDAALRIGLRIAPNAIKRFVGFLGLRRWVRKAPAPETLGNLYESQPPYEVRGGYGPLGNRKDRNS